MGEFLKLKTSNCKNCYKCIRHCPVKSIRFNAGNPEMLWLVCAATLSETEYILPRPKPKIKTTIRAGREWLPVAREEHNRRIKGSALDLSAFAEPGPAGKFGRVIVRKDGHLAFEKSPDQIQRFLSACVSFKLKSRSTTVSTEILAGFTTFAAMSYIMAVNPAILGLAGMDKPAVVTVTALAAAFGCFAMALLTNLPIALAPAMGTNTYFAIIVCVGMGLDWRQALAATFYNGIFFLIISVLILPEIKLPLTSTFLKLYSTCVIDFIGVSINLE